MKKLSALFFTMMLLVVVSCSNYSEPTVMKKWKNGKTTIKLQDQLTVSAGDKLLFDGGKDDFVNFELTGMAKAAPGSTAALMFHTDGTQNKGYEVLFHNGPIDGTRKTGSLSTVRNLYRSLADDDTWFPFYVAVRGKNVSIQIKGVDVVCYTEPDSPYRIEQNKGKILSSGNFELLGYDGSVDFKDLVVTALPADAINPMDTMPPIDEQNDDIIKLQQTNFPVIDYHVHVKGGLTDQEVHALSMNYGINYGIGPNAYGPMQPGEGGNGTMYTSDVDLGEYYENVKDMPFMRAVQGEGRKWLYSFSKELLLKFDYLYTDGMTIVDHRGKTVRMYRPEEVVINIPKQMYMDLYVDRIAKILEEEPADFYANAFFLTQELAPDYDKLWTDKRIDKILDVMVANNIAMEINARYKIPSMYIIKRAKDRGLKFSFGTNNTGPDFGRLEYCIEAIKECGLTVDDLWFPTMSTRAERMEKVQYK